VFAVGAVCTACQREYRLGRIYRCESCNSPLDVQYDYGKISRGAFDPARGSRAEGMWTHRELLPVAPEYIVSLGEGRTPLLRCSRLGDQLGLTSLWVKDETRQPTGSFKDRPLSVAVSKGKELGATTVVTASSGNAAAAMSAYAARAGLRAVVLVAADTPSGKLLQMCGSGARVVRVTGSVSNSIELAQAATKAFDWYNVTTTFANPYSVEGDKTVAYEIAAELGWRAPDWIVVPTGSGPLPAGIWKGFGEMHHFGLVAGLPKMVLAQAAGCAPIVEAFRCGGDAVRPWPSPRTVASGIKDPLVGYSEDGTYALKVVRRSGGAAVAVSDEEILRVTRLMAETEGLYAEPTAGTATACAADLRTRGTMGPDDEVVVVSTGHGLKQPFVGTEELEALPEIGPSLAALAALGLDT
jgi:threonine synthase